MLSYDAGGYESINFQMEKILSMPRTFDSRVCYSFNASQTATKGKMTDEDEFSMFD